MKSKENEKMDNWMDGRKVRGRQVMDRVVVGEAGKG